MSRTTPDNVTEYEPEEVQALLEEGKILLVDVREPMEYAAERIPVRSCIRSRVSTPRSYRPTGRVRSCSRVPQAGAPLRRRASAWLSANRPLIWPAASRSGKPKVCPSYASIRVPDGRSRTAGPGSGGPGRNMRLAL